jgi:protein required for attachment to host cells
MTKTWVLVADSTRARVFSAPSPVAALTEEAEIAHPAPLRDRSDANGRNESQAGSHRNLYEPQVDVKSQSLSIFAKKVADYLSDARARGKYEKLVLVAAPAVLGEIRGHLDQPTAKMLARELHKDIVHLTAAQIGTYLV